jgi:hypothetical protein
MALVPGTPNEGTPFLGEPFIFPSIGNVGPPYIATLSLPRLTIGLPMWLFSTPVFPNVPIVSNAPSVSMHTLPLKNVLKNVHLMLILFLLHPLHILLFLLLHLVKASLLVTRRLRRRRKRRTRRRKISKRSSNQLLLIRMETSRNLSPKLANPNSLAGFARVITFSRISLVFPRS